MTVTFLIGGTGNQLFSYSTSGEQDKVSTVFLHPWVRRLLGWTQHEQVFFYEHPGLIRHIVAIGALFLDFILANVFGISLFTQFDTRRLKVSARLLQFARIGYFQTAPIQRSLEPLALQLAPVKTSGLIVAHVRGGDLLALERAGENIYGLLGSAYYQSGIRFAVEGILRGGGTANRLLVLTDDIGYANSLDLEVAGTMVPEIRRVPLGETLSLSIGADWFISSQSTLSYWIVQLRQGIQSVAPQPFQERRDYILPSSTARIQVVY